MDDELITRTVRVRWAKHDPDTDPVPIAADRYRETVCTLTGDAATELNVATVTVQESIWKMLAIRFLGGVQDERFVAIDSIEPVCNCQPLGQCKYEDQTRFSVDVDSMYPDPADDKVVWDSLRDEEAGGYIAAGTPELMSVLAVYARRANRHQ